MAEYLGFTTLTKFITTHFATLVKFVTDHKYLFLDIALVAFLLERAFRFMRFGIRSVIETGISIIISFVLSYYVLTPIIVALINGSASMHNFGSLSSLRIFLIFLPIVIITSSMLIRLRILGSSKIKPIGFLDSMLGMLFGLAQGLLWIYVMYVAIKFLILAKPELVQNVQLDIAREMYLNLESNSKHGKKHHHRSESIKTILNKDNKPFNQEIRDTILFKLLYFFRNNLMPVENMILNYQQDIFSSKWSKCADDIKGSSDMWKKNVLIRIMPKCFSSDFATETQEPNILKKNDEGISIDYLRESAMSSMQKNLNTENQS